eukprot:1052814-Pyramimonas_sp.AAC.1
MLMEEGSALPETGMLSLRSMTQASLEVDRISHALRQLDTTSSERIVGPSARSRTHYATEHKGGS